MREHDLGMEAIRLRASLRCEPNRDDFIWMLDNKVKGKDIDEVQKYTTFHKMRKYLERQTKTCHVSTWGDETSSQILMGLWRDYVSMCVTLGYDLKKKSVLFPRRVQHEHDKVQQLVRIKYDPVMDEKIKAVYPKLDRIYSYEDGDFIIRPPKDFDDFIHEGVNLLHCVCSSGYYRGHVEHTSYIFFLRRAKSPSSPYYTIEYEADTNKIRQCHGYRNKLQNEEIQGIHREVAYAAYRQRRGRQSGVTPDGAPFRGGAAFIIAAITQYMD
jgi:hypothetical protein